MISSDLLTVPYIVNEGEEFEVATEAHRKSPIVSFDSEMLKAALKIAGFHARRLARRLGLSAVNHADIEQEILSVICERQRYFDPARSAWSTFANRVARQALPTIADKLAVIPRSGATTVDISEAERVPSPDPMVHDGIAVALDLERFLSTLPEDLALVARLALAEEGDLGSALRRSGLSSSEFSRRLNEVRMRLISIGLVARSAID